MALAGGSALLLAPAVLFLVLWLRARRVRADDRAARVGAERRSLDLELSLREQQGRLRIVRELHELIVHSVTVIISQADGTRYTAESDPGAAVRSAAAIAEAARKTLASLRRVMTVVREGEADAGPQPRLKTARDLFKVMRDAGLEIEFEDRGERFDLGQAAELAIYRILQESLSNALKYGGEGTEVTVSFSWRDDGLQVLIDDDGVRSAARRAGLDPNEVAQRRSYTVRDDVDGLTEVASGPGITEMRKRAELFGGVLNANSVPGVGFSVSAVFPTLRYHNGVHGVNPGR